MALTLVLLVPRSASTHVSHQYESGKTAAQHIVLTVEPTRSGTEFALGTVGLSVETNELDTKDLSANHKSLVALMRLLGPGTLRLGGNSLDASWWTSNGGPPPQWATNLVTPSSLTMLHELLTATDWKAILGVDLGHFDPTRAADEASHAELILGFRLLSYEIGNEPNNYGDSLVKLRSSSYSPSAYLKELIAYASAMRVATPQIHFDGPDLGALSLQVWLPAIASDKSMSFTAITQHYYPTFYSVSKGICKGTPVPTALELLSPQVRERENEVLQTITKAGQIAHRQTRISETNTTASCDTSGGPATSPVFASALWSLDWILRSASAGIAGLNFHGDFGRCGPGASSPICASSNAAEARGIVTARPEYYGLLAARQLEAGHFIPTQIQDQSTTSDLTTYATKHPDGKITVAIDNFASKGLTVLLKVPGYHRATSEPLIAPSIRSTRDVTFGRSSINAAGVLGAIGTAIPKIDGAFPLKLPATSATVITLHR